MKIKIIMLFMSMLVFLSKASNDTIYVSYDKTVLLLFDSNIIFEDIGSNKIIASKEGNKLKLASTIKTPIQTSLHVELESGKMFAFILKYSSNPKRILYKFMSDEAENMPIKKTSSNSYNDEYGEIKINKPAVKKENNDFQMNCEKINSFKNSSSGVGVVAKSFIYYLGDIYIKNDKLYFKVVFENTTNIPYDIEQIKFIIRGKKGKIKQQALQESEVNPIYIFNESNRIEGKNSNQKTLTKIFVFDKFNYSSEKIFSIEVWESNGDRIFDMKVESSDLLKVKYLN